MATRVCSAATALSGYDIRIVQDLLSRSDAARKPGFSVSFAARMNFGFSGSIQSQQPSLVIAILVPSLQSLRTWRLHKEYPILFPLTYGSDGSLITANRWTMRRHG
jgi:hypothetical protein